jgi:hypothetical protein
MCMMIDDPASAHHAKEMADLDRTRSSPMEEVEQERGRLRGRAPAARRGGINQT